MEIIWNGSRLFYEKTGSGKKVLLLFHGFGQDHSIFGEITSTLSSTFTFYSFDLFYHGKSVWHENDRPLSAEDLKGFMQQFLAKEEINKFSMLGYSIGCRILTGVLHSFADRIENLILVAPEGITTNFWYSVATSSPISRTFFQKMIDRPGIFTSLAGMARMTGIINPKLIRFSQLQMNSVERRKMVFHTWMVFRKLKFGINELTDRINSNKVNVFLFVGKNDPIIQTRDLKDFINKVKDITVKTIDAGHNRILKSLPAELSQLFTVQSDSRRKT